MSVNTKIVTAIYSNLYGTILGGRPSREGHYRYSLLSLLKMTDADFVCYTSEEEIGKLKNFFYTEKHISDEKLTFKIFNFYNFPFTEKMYTKKNMEEIRLSDKCYEIQYSKFIWLQNELNIGDYQNIFWFDAGLSHDGIIPDRYLLRDGTWGNMFFESSLFNNNFLKNLINHTQDKIFVCAKDNIINYWCGPVPEKYYTNFCVDRHIIGGFFGGKKENLIIFCNHFMNYLNVILDNEHKIYFEENIMSLIFYNHPDLFKPLYFDVWWHENAIIKGLDMTEYLKSRKSFYKVLEELN